MKKKLFQTILSCALFAMVPAIVAAEPTASKNALRIAVVNFKKCVEESKLGKQEQTSFEAMKKQMETVLAEKEKSLNDMSEKFNDPDLLDSLSADAETELKRKFRQQNQDLSQLQNQYMQTLQQTNFKVVQKLNEMVNKAANSLAKKESYDLILNEEALFFYSPATDISDKIITFLDEEFIKEQKTNESAPK